MPESTPDAGDLVVEAATAEQALAQVATQLGAGAEIVAVTKVLRGGLGGFFAKEQVQITARPRTAGGGPAAPALPAPAGAAEPAAAGAVAAPAVAVSGPGDAVRGPGEAVAGDGGSGAASSLQRVLGRLAAETDAQERSFGEALRSQLALTAPPMPPAPSAPPSGSVRPPDIGPERAGAAAVAWPVVERAADAREEHVVALDAAAQAEGAVVPTVAWQPAVGPLPPPAGHLPPVARALPPAAAAQPPVVAGGPDWSQDNLRRLGLPPLVVDACADLDPRDDLAWVYAVGSAVATLCRPLPTGDAVITGPRAARFAAAWEVPVVKGGQQPPRRGDFCAPVRDTASGRSWLAWARGARWLHLVVGGDRWRELLFDEPLAVSWAGLEDLPEAISLCADLGLVLGFGPGPARGAEPARANPVDVAMGVRALLPRR